jgi:sugar phosphate isomerase/epimerase
VKLACSPCCTETCPSSDFVSALRAVDYDYVLSMEHEDLLFSPAEGLRKGVELLRSLIPREGRTEIWWA